MAMFTEAAATTPPVNNKPGLQHQYYLMFIMLYYDILLALRILSHAHHVQSREVAYFHLFHS